MQIPEVGGGLVAMDPHTGRVHAVVGGFSFATSQFDRALQAKRQPGSSFKPLVYAAALDNGYKPTSIVLDAPIEIDQGPGKEIWQPKNYDGTIVVRPLDAAARHREVAQPDDGAAGAGHGHAADRRVFQALRRLRRPAAGARHVARRGRDDAAAHVRGLLRRSPTAASRCRPTLIDRIQDRWGHTIWRHDKRECKGCKAEKWQGQAEPALRRRPQADHRPAHRLPDDLDDGGRGPARHGHDRQEDPSQCADRRQDRHHQRREGCLVHRLHARPGGRRLHRLRHAQAPWAKA